MMTTHCFPNSKIGETIQQSIALILRAKKVIFAAASIFSIIQQIMYIWNQHNFVVLIMTLYT